MIPSKRNYTRMGKDIDAKILEVLGKHYYNLYNRYIIEKEKYIGLSYTIEDMLHNCILKTAESADKFNNWKKNNTSMSFDELVLSFFHYTMNLLMFQVTHDNKVLKGMKTDLDKYEPDLKDVITNANN